MDPSISWLQPEHDGPAKALWLRLWHTHQEFDNLNITNGDSDTEICNTSQSTVSVSVSLTNEVNSDKSVFFNRRRKVENRATTRNLNLHENQIMGEYGGCPWRQKNFTYSQGVFGYVPCYSGKTYTSFYMYLCICCTHFLTFNQFRSRVQSTCHFTLFFLRFYTDC